MGWRSEWKAISDRIGGLSKAAEVFLQFWSNKASDPYGVIKRELLPQARNLFASLEHFLAASKATLPDIATQCLERFMTTRKDLFMADNPGDYQRVQAVLTNLLSFKTEFEYHISDVTAATKRLVERAFLHLCRSIVADQDIRAKWKEAYQAGEPTCEKLGAVHLLLHGIWAFKASAEGERTDLVLGDPLRDLTKVQDSAETMVLTEWKVVRNKKELQEKIHQAYQQAKRYSGGILAGYELARYRYLVIVSEKVLEMPPDIGEDEVTYRCVGIAVDPLPPSRH